MVRHRHRRVVIVIAVASAYAILASADGASAAAVVGKAADGTRYSLVGARLVVRLRTTVGGAAVRCGDLAGLTPVRTGHAGLIFGDVVKAAIRRHRGSLKLRVRFARDISSRVSLCFITRRGEDASSPSRRRQARMRLRSGKPVGCRPGRYESTLLSIGDVQILFASRGGLALRACRPGDARPTRLVSDFAGARVAVGPFALSGDVVAAHLYHETRSGDPVSIVGAVNLASGRTIGTIKPHIRASAVAVSSAGVLACIERPTLGDDAPATLLARRLDGQIVTLDGSPGNALSGLEVDGATVSWLHDGAPRSASVAVG
jgi:hypothetical protein